MSSLSSLQQNDFQNALTPKSLQIDMIVQGSLALGPSVFLLVALAAFQGVPPVQPDADTASFYMNLLIALSVYTVSSASAGIFLYNLQFTRSRLESVVSADPSLRSGNALPLSASEKIILHIRNAMIIRTALFESAAFFGLVIILLAAQQGVLYTLEFVWMAVIPYVLLIGLTAMTFPTKERLMQIFREKIVR